MTESDVNFHQQDALKIQRPNHPKIDEKSLYLHYQVIANQTFVNAVQVNMEKLFSKKVVLPFPVKAMDNRIFTTVLETMS